MSKIYWVSFEKTAGVAIRASSEEEAEELALAMDSSEYELAEPEGEWNMVDAFELEENRLGDKWKGI